MCCTLSRAAGRKASNRGFLSFRCLAVVCRLTSGYRVVPVGMWTEGESEGLQTLGIVVVVCSSLKLLHYLGLIDLSDGKRTCNFSSSCLLWFKSLSAKPL